VPGGALADVAAVRAPAGGPEEPWQADETYLPIPGHRWLYAVTGIDYSSRYLPACLFAASYRGA
jgi:hypothetical protein